ncbi:MAG: DUF5693 family protein [Oscillospiraceae bacterium]|nr:DUF5693 family protein [Oscillospiraceae bacterium]
MSDNRLQTGANRPSFLKWIAVVLLIAALICALWVNFGLRASVELEDTTVGLFVDYDELWRIANATHDMELYDMMRKAYTAGATGIVIRERILADWEIAGDIISIGGGQFKFQLETMNDDSVHALIDQINPDGTYIFTRDPLVFDQIFTQLAAKERYPTSFEFLDYMVIGTRMHSVERGNLGLGFPLAQLEQAAEIGFHIIPRIRTWDPVTDESLSAKMTWLSKIPNMIAIGFNDSTMPGGGDDPDIQDKLAQYVGTLGKPIVSFEFFTQIGLGGIATRLDNGFMRVHAIAENELNHYRNVQDAADRFSLAATERNISFIYLRFMGLMSPAASMDRNLELIEFVHAELERNGLTVGIPEPLPNFSIPFVAFLIIGVGIISAGGWLLALVAEPFFARKKWQIPFVLLMLFAFAVWTLGLFFAPAFIRKLFALAAAIVLPTLGIILVLLNRDNWPPFRKNIMRADGSAVCETKSTLRAITHLLIMSALTLSGAFIMSALLSEPVFMVKLDTFIGVNIAQLIPLALVPFILWVREEDWFGLINGTVKSHVKVWQLALSLIMLAALALFFMRTGNENPDAVLDIELRFRQLLHNILGVRPRTSEFLIGHPLMLVMLYFGYKFNMFPLLIAGVLGQASLMNTYAHLHTPVLISLERSLHGLWMGIAVGVVLIIILELIFKKIRVLHRLNQTGA